MPFAGDLIQIAAIKVGPIKSDPELGVLISAFGNHLKLSGQTGSCKSTDAFFAQDSPTTRCLLVLLLEGCGGFQPCIPDCLKGHSDTVVFYLGVGWDAGYHSRAELKEMWAALGPDVLARLEEAAGKKGRAAQALIPKLRVIEIPRSVSIQVLRRSLNEHYYPFVLRERQR